MTATRAAKMQNGWAWRHHRFVVIAAPSPIAGMLFASFPETQTICRGEFENGKKAAPVAQVESA